MQFVGVDGKGIGGVVVSLRSTDPSRPPAKPVSAILDQVDQQFVPHVLVIPVGASVSFPNSDSVAHQVYSFSDAHEFQLPLYSGKPEKPEVFRTAGIVTLGCNIHDLMAAYVYVVDGQYYGRAGHDGKWSSAAVEPGEYTLTIWHPLSRSLKPVLEQKVTVKNDGTALVVRAASKLKLRSESQVPANWDSY